MLENIVFYSLSFLILFSALVIITRTNPIASALAMVSAFIGLAGIYFLLGAEILSAIQILVYAGGIMVLILFVIMILNLDAAELRPTGPRMIAVLGGLVLSLAGVAPLVLLFRGGPALPTGKETTVIGLREIAIRLFSDYIFPFEVLSLLLLAALVGSLVMARRRL